MVSALLMLLQVIKVAQQLSKKTASSMVEQGFAYIFSHLALPSRATVSPFQPAVIDASAVAHRQ